MSCYVLSLATFRVIARDSSIFSLVSPLFFKPMCLREDWLSGLFLSAAFLAPCYLPSGGTQLQAVGNPGVWPQVGLLVSSLTHSEHSWGTSCWAGPWLAASTGPSLPAGIHRLVGEADIVCVCSARHSQPPLTCSPSPQLSFYLCHSREKIDSALTAKSIL